MQDIRKIFESNTTKFTVVDYSNCPIVQDTITFDQFQQAIADYEKSKWKTGFPDLIEGKRYSHNVIAEVEGFTDLQVMSIFLARRIGEDVPKWARVYDGLDGDGQYDDNYNVIRWTEIPTPPTK